MSEMFACKKFCLKEVCGGIHMFVYRESLIQPLQKNALLVKVIACGIPMSLKEYANITEHYTGAREGIRLHPVGCDVAGVVVQIGAEVNSFSKGDSVVGIVPASTAQSGCSEYVIFQEFEVVLKPEDVTYESAACCIGDAVRAYTALNYLAKVTLDTTVFILDGSSSFGSICIQLAKHWRAKVLSTCSSEAENRYLQSLGVDESCIIDVMSISSVVPKVMLETGDLGVDIIVDDRKECFPKAISNIYAQWHKSLYDLISWKDLIQCLCPRGKLITSKDDIQLDPPQCKDLYFRCASICFLFDQTWVVSPNQQGKYQTILADVMEKLSSKVIRANIHRTIPFGGLSDFFRMKPDLREKVVVLM